MSPPLPLYINSHIVFIVLFQFHDLTFFTNCCYMHICRGFLRQNLIGKLRIRCLLVLSTVCYLGEEGEVEEA